MQIFSRDRARVSAGVAMLSKGCRSRAPLPSSAGPGKRLGDELGAHFTSRLGWSTVPIASSIVESTSSLSRTCRRPVFAGRKR